MNWQCLRTILFPNFLILCEQFYDYAILDKATFFCEMGITIVPTLQGFLARLYKRMQ